MPQIIVTSDHPGEDGAAPMMFRERVTELDFESEHSAAKLMERLRWAVQDAQARDRRRTHPVEAEVEDRSARPGAWRDDDSALDAEPVQLRRSARVVTTAS